MRISDWSSDVCSSDLQIGRMFGTPLIEPHDRRTQDAAGRVETDDRRALRGERDRGDVLRFDFPATPQRLAAIDDCTPIDFGILFGPARLRRFIGFCEDLLRLGKQFALCRSEEHTSELQSLMRISYAVFCLKKKKNET